MASLKQICKKQYLHRFWRDVTSEKNGHDFLNLIITSSKNSSVSSCSVVYSQCINYFVTVLTGVVPFFYQNLCRKLCFCPLAFGGGFHHTNVFYFQGLETSQVVFPEKEGSTDSCNVKLTEANWRSEISIPIQAAQDGVIDGNQRVQVSLTNRIDTVTDINTVKTVEVCVYICTLIAECIVTS